MFLNLILIISSFIMTGKCARILVISSAPSISHKVVFRPFNNELLNQGHEVVFVTSDLEYPNKDGPTNLMQINVHDLLYESYKPFLSKLDPAKGVTATSHFEVVHDIYNEICANLLKSKEFSMLIKDNSFDLIVLEAFHKCMLPLSHVLQRPVLQLSTFSSMADYETMGAPVHPLLYPEIVTQRIYNLTIYEKIKELFVNFSFQRIVSRKYTKYENLLNDIIPNIPDQRDLLENVDFLFLTSNPVWEENRPIPLGVSYLMGLQEKKQIEMSEDLRTFLDSSKKGVIYFSLGTNVQTSSLPFEKVQLILNVLSILPYDVLLKWDKEHLPNAPANVKVYKWLPQIDILMHPNLKLFITQAGAQSTEEAIFAGVPLVGIPMIFDQWGIAEKYVRHEIGKKISLETVTEEEFIDAVKTVISDESYRLNVLKLRDIIQDEPASPEERVARWTNYILKHEGAKHLRPHSSYMTWTEYYEIELLLTLLAIVAVLISLTVAAIVVTTKVIYNKLTSSEELVLDYYMKSEGGKYN